MKKLLSLVLALVLALGLGLTPAAAAATDYPLYWSNVNTYAVQQGGDDWYCPDFWVEGTDLYVQAVSTYHYNYGAGMTPGRIGIFDFETDECLGDWEAVGRYGNQWWDVFPGIVLEGGRHYYIVTSDDEGWSFNADSGNHAFVEVRGYTTGGDVPISPAPGGNDNIPPSRQTAAVEVMVNGSYVQWTDAWPFIDENSRTLVPLRAVAEAMGLQVGWDDARKEAGFFDGYQSIYFPIGSRTAYSGGGGQIAMDTAAVIVNSRTYAPIRYLAEFFGFKVDWDGETRTVLITGAWEDPWGSDDYSFRGMGIDLNVDNHGQQSYRTVTKGGNTVTSYVSVQSYRVFEEDDAFPGTPGYEWRVMTVKLSTPQSDGSGNRYVLYSSNYHDIKLDLDSVYYDSNETEHHTVNWKGKTDEYTLWWRSDSNDSNGATITFTAQVPKGFDGVVVGFMNAEIEDRINSSMYLYQFYTNEQDFALFRMK